MTSAIFYSWQSDTPNNSNRGFIEDALEKAIKEVNKSIVVDEAAREEHLSLDKDTQGVPGSPPIVEAIFKKISKAAVFVPDVTFVGKSEHGRPLPNPNVLIEYGWALRELGNSRIISVMNTAYGEPTADTLPFDMRHLRWPLRYHLLTEATSEERKLAKEGLVKELTVQLRAMQKAGFFELPSEEIQEPEIEQQLKEWHDAVNAHYVYLYVNSPMMAWPVPANVNHYQLSYLLRRPKNAKAIPYNEFMQALNSIQETVQKRVWTGWSMFYPFTRQEIKPYVIPVLVGGEELEVIECNLMNADTGHPDFWRITRTGYASLLRAYREDAKIIKNSDQPLQPGTWFSPRLLVQELAELTAHAAALSQIFGDCSGAVFRCTWYGLRNRVIAEFDPSIHWGHYVSKADTRTTAVSVDNDQLLENWPQIVSDLAAPVTILFDGMEISEEWVKYISPTFRKL